MGMVPAGRPKGMLENQHRIISPIERLGIAEMWMDVLGSAFHLEIQIQEFEHLRPGFSLDPAGFDEINIRYKCMRLVRVDRNFMRHSCLFQSCLKRLDDFDRDGAVRPAKYAEQRTGERPQCFRVGFRRAVKNHRGC